MTQPTPTDFTTDYLVLGAGISGLSFVDELLTRTTASIIIVDRRDAPGGHWNDAYPFVRLHGPPTLYGVGSKELSDFRIDEHGPNKGLLTLTPGPEVVAYCHALMRERFLPSGRVKYLPSTEHVSGGIVRGVHSGKRSTIHIRKKLVNAAWYTNEIAATHTRSFAIAPSVTCAPPNDLPRLAARFKHFTVLGGGKTGIDSCMWLLSNGVDPKRIRWIIPNDYWYFNRAKMQTTPEFFNDVLNTVADKWEALAEAQDPKDMAHRFERCDFWHRLDPKIEPPNFHSAIVSKGELEELRKISDVVRNGYVTRIEPDQVQLTQGTVAAVPYTLYIDCTATALSARPLLDIFQPGQITVQIVRTPLVATSAALIAFIESLPMSDEERNALVAPVPVAKTVEEHVSELAVDLQNRLNVAQNPHTKKWASESRLDGFSLFAASMRPEDHEKRAIVARVMKEQAAAVFNLPKLLATMNPKPHL